MRTTIFALLIAVPALAQDTSATKLPPMVTVTRQPARSPMDLPFGISTVMPDSLRPGQAHVAADQALLMIPGITVANRTNPSQDPRVSIRGFGARSAFGVRSVRIIRDGMPLTLPDGQTPLDYLDLESVGRIDVIRGTASALYGNASGGVIDMSSAAPDNVTIRPEARVWFGSDALRRTTAVASGTSGAWSYQGNVGQTEADNYLIEITSRKGNKAKGRHILFPIELAGSHRDQIDAQADSLERLGADRADRAALDTVSRALKLPIGHSGPVQEGTKVQLGQLVIGDAGVWAFQAKMGATSPVIESPNAYYVFRLDSLKPAGVPPLSEIRSAVTALARGDKKTELARGLAKDFMKRLESDTSLGRVAEEMKLPHKEFGPFPRVQPPLDDPVVVGTAFGLDVGQHSPILDTKNGIYIIKVLEHTKADSADFVKGTDQFRAQMIGLARQERIRSYLAALKDAAKVVDNRKKVLQAQQRQTATS